MKESDPNVAALQARFDDLRVIERLAVGGQSSTYLLGLRTGKSSCYIDARTPRVVAKVMHPRSCNRFDTATIRFQNEAKFLCDPVNHHGNIVKGIAATQLLDGRPCLLMAWALFGDLTLAIKTPIVDRKGTPLKIIEAVANALHFLHSRGMVHRDVKPSNVLIAARWDAIWLADLGMMKIPQENVQLTNTGRTVGTFEYLPERVRGGGEHTVASDIFGLAHVAYFVLMNGFPGPKRQQVHLDYECSKKVDRVLDRAWEEKYIDALKFSEDLADALLTPNFRSRWNYKWLVPIAIWVGFYWGCSKQKSQAPPSAPAPLTVPSDPPTRTPKPLLPPSL